MARFLAAAKIPKILKRAPTVDALRARKSDTSYTSHTCSISNRSKGALFLKLPASVEFSKRAHRGSASRAGPGPGEGA